MARELEKTMVHVIVAAGTRGEIGAGSTLPWPRLARDMARFKHVTETTLVAGKRNVVIMGRRTWDTLNGRPLRGRINVVMSRQPRVADGVVFVDSVAACCAYLDAHAEEIEAAFLIGGGQVIGAFLAEQPERMAALHLTYVMAEFPHADAFVDVAALERFFPTLYYRTSEPDAATGIVCDFALRWRLLSDL